MVGGGARLGEPMKASYASGLPVRCNLDEDLDMVLLPKPADSALRFKAWAPLRSGMTSELRSSVKLAVTDASAVTHREE